MHKCVHVFATTSFLCASASLDNPVCAPGAKARFREKEQQVYEELHDLVQRADVHRDALAATYSVTRDIMALAEARALWTPGKRMYIATI